MATDLILAVIDGEPRIDSRLVAVELGVIHRNTFELVDKYSAQFQELGILRFETEKPQQGSVGGRPPVPNACARPLPAPALKFAPRTAFLQVMIGIKFFRLIHRFSPEFFI